MSWQAYVDTNLVGSGFVSQAGIYGINGGGLWAASPGFSMKPAEIQAILNGFTDAESVRANGVRINDVKYLTIKVDDRSIYGRKNASGFCIVKTVQAILVALYDEKIQPGACNKVVEDLADYLISVGY